MICFLRKAGRQEEKEENKKISGEGFTKEKATYGPLRAEDASDENTLNRRWSEGNHLLHCSFLSHLTWTSDLTTNSKEKEQLECS